MKYLLTCILALLVISVHAQKLETAPPSPSLIYDYHVDSVGVFIGLMPSSSRNVVAHKLYRKLQKTENWKLIETFSNEVPQVYLDNTLISNGRYTYKWVAENKEGLQSNADHSLLNISAFDSRTFYKPNLQLAKLDKGIELIISNKIPGDQFRIEIIRSIDGGQYRTLSIIKNKNHFIDGFDYPIESKVSYRAKILYNDGMRSKYSNEEVHHVGE